MPRSGLAVQSGLRVEHDLTDLLRAPTRIGYPSRPHERFLTRGHLDDREPAHDRLCLRYGSVCNGSVGRYYARSLALDPATEDPHSRGLGRPDHRMRRLAYRRPVL